ncbi:MAG: glycosyltransferase family A protein [Chloroflexota bacterium]|nr:glycosyltransferase family A protein [Chloroflexota bacterium]
MLSKSLSTVSVVKTVYNGEKYLSEAIESILSQTFTDIELLLVVHGSTDESAAISQALAERDNRIGFFQPSQNMGMAVARNRGIAAATGEFIAIMDCDDVSLPQRLEKQVAFLRSNPEIGALGAAARAVNHDMSTHLYDFESQQQHALTALDTFLGYSFLRPTLLIQRESITAVGGYEPGRRNCDGLELWSRLLRETRIRFANLPECLVLYRRPDQSRLPFQSPGEQPVERELKRGKLERFWNAAPEATMDRLYRLRLRKKLSRTERRAAERDFKRPFDSMITHGRVGPEDKPVLFAAMNRRLEGASPRIWQQICHWRRHHFSRGEGLAFESQ